MHVDGKRCVGYVLLALSLAGCSSYEVARLSPAADLGGKADGVVFRLGRPEFSLKKVEGSTPQKYQPQVVYVADSNQRYAIRSKTSPLADGLFDLAFNEHGGLSSATSDSQQQVGPIVTAVAGFATKAMTASNVIAGLYPSQTPIGYVACLNRKGMGQMADCALEVGKAQSCPPTAARLNPSARLKFFYREDKDLGDPLAVLVAYNQAEKACFTAAGSGLQQAVNTTATDIGFKMVAILPVGDPTTRAVVDEMAAITKEGDVKRARRLVYAAALAAGPSDIDAAPLKKILGRDVSPAQALPIVSALKAAQMSAEDDVTPVEMIAKGNKVAKALIDAATLDPGPWRARVIANLQPELAAKQREKLMADPTVDLDADAGVETVRTELAAMVNMAAEFRRLRALQEVIHTVPGFDATSRQSAMIEYAAYRKEADAIDKELAARLEATQAKTADKTVEETPLTVAWVRNACVAKSKQAVWRYTYGVDAPAFIIVLKDAETGAALDPSTSTLGCAQ